MRDHKVDRMQHTRLINENIRRLRVPDHQIGLGIEIDESVRISPRANKSEFTEEKINLLL